MGLKLMVVDDDADLRSLVQKVAAQRGHQVVLAEDGAKALERIHAEKPDAISLDLQMPNLDGRDVMSRLKRDPATRDIPVVVVTSMDDEFTRELCLGLGADDFVDKPFDAHHLVGKLEFLVEKRRDRAKAKR
jgi:two-component system alkaline phosphatase synthesis response regulator PhoP